MSARDFPQLY